MLPRFSTFTILLLCSTVFSHLVNRRVIRQIGVDPCQNYTSQHTQLGKQTPDNQPDVTALSRTICDTDGVKTKFNSKGYEYARPQPSLVNPPPQSWTNPPQPSWANRPPQSWANRPQQSWTNPPQQSWTSPPQQSWTNRPQQSWTNRPQPPWTSHPQQSWTNRPQPSWTTRPQPSWTIRTQRTQTTRAPAPVIPPVSTTTTTTSTITTTTSTITTAITTTIPATTTTSTVDSGQNSQKNKYAVCGKSSRNAVKIIGGKNATLGDWPWMVAIGYRTPSNPGPLFKCGGTLIADVWVLTAAHCIPTTRTSTVTVARLGDLDLTEHVDDGASPIDIPIAKIIVHPEYSASPLLNDIALLRLQTPVTFTALIRPLCLPKQMEQRSDAFYTNKAPFIAGWGYTQSRNFSSRSYHLKEAQVDIDDQESCRNKFKFSALNSSLIDDRVLCAGRRGVDSCQGDSGGPLTMPIKASYYLIGVVSYGIDCANPFYPGVYTKVAYYYDWIKSTTGVEF